MGMPAASNGEHTAGDTDSMTSPRSRGRQSRRTIEWPTIVGAQGIETVRIGNTCDIRTVMNEYIKDTPRCKSIWALPKEPIQGDDLP